MRALSLWQPWASAIACGAKRIETRSWATSYTGPLAIHAAKTWNDECALAYGFLAEREEFCRLLPHGADDEILPLPFGAIVATAELVACRPVEEIRDGLTSLETALGNYSAGRFGWLLTEVKRLERPVPARGRQGLWRWEEAV